jgi:GTP-binding protein
MRAGISHISRRMRAQWDKLFTSYITLRENLVMLFVLIDARHEPMTSDLAFMERMALNGIPFARVFTKTDKLSPGQADKNIVIYDNIMLESWESLPPTFITSAVRGTGRDELLNYINETMIFYKSEK